MTPATLKALSLYPELVALFERAKSGRRYGLRALPEEQFAAFLVEELAMVLVRGEDLIERLSARSEASDFTVLFDGVSTRSAA
jgi:hypothetical protein